MVRGIVLCGVGLALGLLCALLTTPQGRAIGGDSSSPSTTARSRREPRAASKSKDAKDHSSPTEAPSRTTAERGGTIEEAKKGSRTNRSADATARTGPSSAGKTGQLSPLERVRRKRMRPYFDNVTFVKAVKRIASATGAEIDIDPEVADRVKDPHFLVDLSFYTPVSALRVLKMICSMKRLEVVEDGGRLLIKDEPPEKAGKGK